MAAYAALVSLARLIDQILPRDQDYTFLCDKKQMVSLHQKTVLLQEFLEYDSNKHILSVANVLEGRIKDAAYQLEHIIESIICKPLAQLAKPSRQLLSEISCISGNQGEAGSHTSTSVEQVTTVFFNCIAEIDIILEEAKAKKFFSPAHSSTASSSRGAPTAEVINVGLNNACTRMLNTVTSKTSSLLIIPITGMGGIGKTTLASAVYSHSKLLNHFDVRLWVTISQEYDLQEVLRGLLSTIKQTEQSDGSLFDRVHKYLKGRRFLIVLDDMWHGKAWDGVMNAFPDDNKGSRIILTTRQLGVAMYVGSSNNVHTMQLLNEDQSWNMLRGKVFREKRCPAELGDIGRTISKNCKGLPLAIVVIAGLLKQNKMKDYWEEIAKNTNAAASTDSDELFGILSLSYTNLPPQLKACFLYVGAYPEDYEFQVTELKMLWTAEGFLKPRESKTMEDIAEECIEELVERSLFLVKKKTHLGKIKTFSIHDVLREVSMKKAKDEKFLQHNRTSTVRNRTNDQHNVSSLKNDLNFLSNTYNAHIRSFKYTTPIESNLPACHPTSLSGVLCKTTSLRYLHVVHCYHSQYISFSKSIYELQNLETFITRNIQRYGPGDTLPVPLDIWKLQRLRHIIVGRGCRLEFPKAGEFGYPILESLQTLCGVKDANFSMDVIKRIPNVKILKLFYEITYLGKKEFFTLSNLQHLHQLEELSIRLKRYDQVSDIAFPRNLKKLNLRNTVVPLENFISVIGSLPNLEVLKLKSFAFSFIDNIWEPVEGEFLQLKYLKMEDLDMEEWRVESFHFPSLQKLEIVHCSALKEVPECIGEIDTLEELILDGCIQAKESVLTIRENQQALGNDLLNITIIRCDGPSQELLELLHLEELSSREKVSPTPTPTPTLTRSWRDLFL